MNNILATQKLDILQIDYLGRISTLKARVDPVHMNHLPIWKRLWKLIHLKVFTENI